MIKTSKQQQFLKRILCLSLALIVFSVSFVVINPEQNSYAQQSQQRTPSCQPSTKKFLDTESTKYQKFLRDHMRSKKATGDLLVVANQRYIQYRLAVINKKNLLAIQQAAIGAGEQDRQICEQIIDQYLKTMSAWHKRMLVGNAERKRTHRLTERLRDLNGKLKDLNRNTGVLQGYFEAFSSKIPCYTKSCISF